MPQNTKLTQQVLHYQYPPLLLRYPKLIWVTYLSNYFTQLRKWYIIKEWQQILEQANENFVAIDFGSGECQYLVPFCSRFAHATFYATDINVSNIAFSNSLQIDNLKSVELDIEKKFIDVNANVAICVGVLHYIEDDRAALQNINKSLSAGALLLLYVPINGTIITQVYSYIFKKYSQYESLNNRQRIYLESDITEKLLNTGFNIQSKKYAYGFWGRLSHELLNSFTTLVFSAVWPVKILAYCGLLLCLPIIILFMLFDFLSNNKTGNGLLIKAIKI
ncbi:MAG: class I SAM-dependent methyltransferase [Deinococcales bacterium]|nr:class I SAM-dependent methyltransferase [Chitinophagaceae bacterium]